MLTASLKVLARLAGQGRSTVAEGIKRLAELGLISKIRRRVRVVWGAIASRQIANAYVLQADDTESGKRTAEIKPQTIISVLRTPTPTQRAAQEALAARRRQIERNLLRVAEGRSFPDMQKCSNNLV